ncbi:hypothetical protein PM082_009502 [Marasmius tenuissimus]|nr:hypothetical protein PM082_009502 [Marasmius tenuissimus]
MPQSHGYKNHTNRLQKSQQAYSLNVDGSIFLDFDSSYLLNYQSDLNLLVLDEQDSSRTFLASITEDENSHHAEKEIANLGRHSQYLIQVPDTPTRARQTSSASTAPRPSFQRTGPSHPATPRIPSSPVPWEPKVDNYSSPPPLESKLCHSSSEDEDEPSKQNSEDTKKSKRCHKFTGHIIRGVSI